MTANAGEKEQWNDEAWVRGWIRREVITQAVTAELIAALHLRPGETVLDVGCGGGRTTIAAARQVGPSGRVVGADISAPLLALARERADAAAPVRFEQADMQIDHVEGGPFDVATSQFGVMFFDDPVAAFANIGGHLGPGGRLGFVCWQVAERNPWFIGPVVAPYITRPRATAPGAAPKGPFALGEPDRVQEILAAAGFAGVGIEPVERAVEVPAETVGDGAQLAFMGVPPEAIADATDALRAYMTRFASGAALRLPLAYQIVWATGRDGAGA